MLKDKVIYIVGEKIKRLVPFSNVINYSEFMQQHMVLSTEGWTVILGQGLSALEISSVILVVSTFKSGNNKIGNSYAAAPLLSPVLVHKHELKNTLVSVPEKVAENLYMAYLCVDDSCAELSDHLTGSHIPGMLLIEAARQMVTAVTEKFLKSESNNYAFILNQLGADFKHYVFYLEVQLFYKLLEIRHGLNGAFTARAQVNFVQNNISVTSIAIKHQLMDKIVMDNYELTGVTECLGTINYLDVENEN